MKPRLEPASGVRILLQGAVPILVQRALPFATGGRCKVSAVHWRCLVHGLRRHIEHIEFMILGGAEIVPPHSHQVAAEAEKAAAGHQDIENVALLRIEYEVCNLAEPFVF